MTFESDYKFMEKLTKVFRLDNNTVANNLQRTGSVVATNNSTSEQKDSLCANMISEVVKVAAERVKSKQQSRTASITSKTDEVALLKGFLSRAYQ
jgi:hypothetical protein